MPENDVIERAYRDAQEGKSPSTQAGEFVREEIEHAAGKTWGALPKASYRYWVVESSPSRDQLAAAEK
jgi:hypothetical protein